MQIPDGWVSTTCVCCWSKIVSYKRLRPEDSPQDKAALMWLAEQELPVGFRVTDDYYLLSDVAYANSAGFAEMDKLILMATREYDTDVALKIQNEEFGPAYVAKLCEYSPVAESVRAQTWRIVFGDNLISWAGGYPVLDKDQIVNLCSAVVDMVRYEYEY